MPVDWDTADGSETFNISMVKLPRPSNSTVERIGSLFLNPGGPRESAITAVANIASGIEGASSDILDHFDVLGVDPRGVSNSVTSLCDEAT